MSNETAKINEAELRSEAAIYAEGTAYSTDDLVRAYRQHVSECDEKGVDAKYPQAFFAEDLGIEG